ncbi:reverse transcriptase/maturase family protein [Bacillus chungangensis]|uniref:Retron-type reverse transcriptase n=1 Tax=Bacillus chungangensis TaxID=587633 RepID=A0ABT9WRK0_9BACI|nr:reverse transcriptase/maturase family protein [Bacillus chungangensis]MDQ0175729.1 retron-type reverse transcriptase [Bacillus chungangensis]
MRNPDWVLESLHKHSKNNNYRFQKLYRNLYNPAFYQKAYAILYQKKGNNTSKQNELPTERVETLIEQLKTENYQPISIKGGVKEKQPFADKLVQEVLKQLLTAIFASRFSPCSHQHLQPALSQIKQQFRAIKWWIIVDIKESMQHIHHETLIQIMRKSIDDEKLLRLIRKFLKAGYLANFEFDLTDTGIRKQSFSNLLASIYLQELDKGMEKRMERYSENSQQKMAYIRYANHCLIGIIGKKQDAENMKKQLHDDLTKTLRLPFREEQIKMSHWREKIRFLDYDMFIVPSQKKNSGFRQNDTGTIKFSMPYEILRAFLLKHGYMKIVDGKWKALHRPRLLHCDDHIILQAYNTEFKRFCRYYQIAFDAKEKLGKAHFIFRRSFTKTLAGKYRTKVRKLMSVRTASGKKKYFFNGVWGVMHRNKDNEEQFLPLFQKEHIVYQPLNNSTNCSYK